MDELEIRRRLLANPQDAVDNLSSSDRLLQTELLELDKELTKALQIPVPSDLADRLLFNQPRRRYWPLALAASVALVSLLSFQAYALQSTTDIPLSEVNQLLAEVGGNLTTGGYPVRYARFCDFEGTRSLHLVFAKEDGLVTVFVVPKNHGLKPSPEFSDPQFFGKSQQFAQAEIVMVATQQQLLDPFAKTLMEKMRFHS